MDCLISEVELSLSDSELSGIVKESKCQETLRFLAEPLQLSTTLFGIVAITF
jgi:hypothetical protein